jgi:hypothetical protein
MTDPKSELRAGILAELKRQQSSAPQDAPDAPGMTASDKPEARETAAQLYAQALLDRKGGLTPQERDFLRQSLRSYQESQGD